MDRAETRAGSVDLVIAVAVAEAEADALVPETTEAALVELTEAPGLEIAALWVTATAPDCGDSTAV
jgi:hypothetical protein